MVRVSTFKIGKGQDASTAVPPVLRVAAAVSWRLLVVIGAFYVLGIGFSRLSQVVIPVAVALLFTALLLPAVNRLQLAGAPRGLATAVVFIGGLALVSGVLTFVISNFVAGIPDMQRQVLASLERLRVWLAESPLNISSQQIQDFLQQIETWFQENQGMLTTGAISTASTFGTFLTGLFLALFTLIFFLYDGRGVWLFLIRVVPGHARERVDVAGVRGFNSLVGYVRATALVAVVDAVGIWLGLAIMQVPLAVPLATLVFLGAFVPIVGAVASGVVAVLVALVSKGFVAALIILIVVLAVQQLEGNVLQPLLLGRAVQIHALAVVLGISAGLIVYGIPGALLAVPLIAVLNSAIRSLVSDNGGSSGSTRVEADEVESSATSGTEENKRDEQD